MNRDELIRDRDAILASMMQRYHRIVESGVHSIHDETYMSTFSLVHQAICRQLDMIATPPAPNLDARRLDHAIAELERCLTPGTSSTPLVKGVLVLLKQMQAKGGAA